MCYFCKLYSLNNNIIMQQNINNFVFHISLISSNTVRPVPFLGCVMPIKAEGKLIHEVCRDSPHPHFRKPTLQSILIVTGFEKISFIAYVNR